MSERTDTLTQVICEFDVRVTSPVTEEDLASLHTFLRAAINIGVESFTASTQRDAKAVRLGYLELREDEDLDLDD
jgi:hypothetical protein